MAPRRAIASVMIRRQVHYRHECFAAGFAARGYDVRTAFPPKLQENDVIAVWNRNGPQDVWAGRFEDAGARAVVAENGYIGKGFYALALHQHNGAGTWPVGDAQRWQSFGIKLKPWRKRGRHILVLPQRGVGPLGVAMPRGWLKSVTDRLLKVTDRPIKVRPHPGKDKRPLEPDLADCWCCVTWASGAGIKALAAGVPVVHELPQWIGAPAASRSLASIEDPYTGDRLSMFERLAWAQWTLDEIKSGEAFAHILGARP